MSEQLKNLSIISPEQEFNFVALPGQSVRQLLEQLPEWSEHESLVVYNHGHEIKDIDGFIVNEGDRLLVYLVPQGGGGGGSSKQIIGIVAAIAIIAVAWWNPMGWAAAGALLTTSTLYSIGAGLLLSSVGTMLAPKPSLGTSNTTGSSERENSYFLSGQSNGSRPYSPVLVAYGRNKIFPLLAANPNIINVGKDSTFDALYDFGIGEQSFDLNEIKFGDTLANAYSPQYFRHVNTKTPALQLITNRFGYQDYSVKLAQNVPFTARTKDNTINAEVNIAFSSGLAYFDNNGNTQGASVDFRVEWRSIGGDTWNFVSASNFSGANVSIKTNTVNSLVAYEGESVTATPGTRIAYGADSRWAYADVDGSGVLACDNNTFGDPAEGTYKACYVQSELLASEVTVSGATTAPFVVVASIFFPTAGTYEVRITRTSAVSTNNRLRDDAVFTLLESRVAGNVLNLSAPHTMLEMRVKASDRLSGTVQNLSVITTSILNTYNASGVMVGRVATRNPAWIAIDILCGAANPRPIRLDQIDWPAWKALADICDTPRTWTIGGQIITSPRFICDVVIDYETTVKELIESVLSTCRSGLTIGLNGRYSVMFDGERTIPRQVITPSNSWNFTASRQFPPEVHALKVSFIDSASDYDKQEVIVYRDGYNASNAEKFEDVGTLGITTYQHAWAYGRYMMAAAINRAEVFTVTMDVENLACQRGDLVHVAHDVPLVGGQPAYVVSVSGSNVEITEELSASVNAYTVRLSDGTIRQGVVTGRVSGNTFVLDNTTGITPDNLIVIGEADRVVKAYIVSQVAPSTDLTANLTLLPYIPEVYNADIGALPEWRPEISVDLINASNLAITSVSSAGQVMEYVDRMPQGKFVITWAVNRSDLSASYDLAVTTLDGQRQIFTGITTERYEYVIDLVNNPLAWGNVTFTVTPYTSGGIAGTSGSTVDLIYPDRSIPAPVNWFMVNVQDMDIAISWEPPLEQDIGEYEIRYSPLVEGAAWNSSQIVGKFAHNVTRTMVGARTGTYMIVVRDTSGNVSSTQSRRTTIERLPNINLIEQRNDYPLWTGTRSQTELEGTTIQLAGEWGNVFAEGYYYYESILDLGEIYEVRIANKIQSHGADFQDLMVNWTPLASVLSLSSVVSSQFNAMLEVRTANEVNFMGDWTPIASAIPIGGANPEAWSPWRPCEVGDFTGRIFQFRIRMQSFDPLVRAVVDDGLIEVDVKDRIDRFSDLAVPSTGLTVNFDPAFMEPPTLAVTTENTTASRHAITAKSRTSFTVQLFNASGVAVAGQVDVLALGYGRERPNRI